MFAGCGGTTEGLKWAGFHVRAAAEFDSIAASTYAVNHPEVELLEEDLREVSRDTIAKVAGVAVGETAVVVGCPPCQGFSTHRLKDSGAGDPRNELVDVFADHVLALQPPFFVFENVPGLLRQSASPWPVVRDRLEQNGYRVIDGTLESADYGVPQRRKRLVALGCRAGSTGLRLPEPTHADPTRGRPPDPHLLPWRTVRDAIEGLPPPVSDRNGHDPLHYLSRHTDSSLRRFAAIPKDGGSRRDLPRALQLRCHENHNGHRDVYGRLWWDRPATTITSGCTQPSKGRFLHPERDRGLTLREAARLQGFPDHYKFEGTKQQIALQIGNAVPPPLSYAIGLAIRDVLSGESTLTRT